MAKRKKTPQNKVGHRVPTAAEVEAERERLNALQAFAESLGPALNKAERTRITKPRRGSELTSETILSLASQHNLTSRLITVEAAQRDQALFQAIGLLTQQAFNVWKHLRDVYLQARGEHWEGVLSFYGVLDHMAQTDPQLSENLEPVVEFFSLDTSEKDEKDEDDKQNDEQSNEEDKDDGLE